MDRHMGAGAEETRILDCLRGFAVGSVDARGPPEGTGEGQGPSRPPMAGADKKVRLSGRHLKEAGDQEFVR
jgi:hypothetical protein